MTPMDVLAFWKLSCAYSSFLNDKISTHEKHQLCRKNEPELELLSTGRRTTVLLILPFTVLMIFHDV
jgi:hypothetical protein